MDEVKTDLVTCSCSSCGGHVQFERQHTQERIECPHCGMETILHVPVGREPAPPEPPPHVPANPYLRTCRDCGKEISIHAAACPNCGAILVRVRRHGVFFYVFWGVVSLLVTVVILGVATSFLTVGIPAFLKARQEARDRVAGTNAQTQTPASGSGITSTNKSKAEKLDYIKTQLQIYEFKSRYYDSVLEGKTPGVEFKLRNKGDRTVTEVEVTVHFKDSTGTIIAEERYHPILVTEYELGNNAPLKPGYIWQMERGHFYAAKRVPSEWQEGLADVTITDIAFAAANSVKNH